VHVEPDRQTIAQGTSGELRCVATGDPAPTVTWTKVNDEMGRSVQVTGNILRILSAMDGDRGVYACTATSHGGEAVAYATIEVESEFQNGYNVPKTLKMTNIFFEELFTS
jgi:hypothetical protein